MYTPEKMDLIKAKTLSSLSQFQAFRRWGVSKKLVGRGQKIDEGKNRAGKVSPRFFSLVFLFVLAAYNLTLSSHLIYSLTSDGQNYG